MTKQFLKKQEEKLRKIKQEIEKQLKTFAAQDPNIKGNWEAKFPDFGAKTADLSGETDQVEEYEATLPVEYALEARLQKVNTALGKIENPVIRRGKNTYGTCQNCKKRITIERLEAEPEAELCIKCTT